MTSRVPCKASWSGFADCACVVPPMPSCHCCSIKWRAMNLNNARQAAALCLSVTPCPGHPIKDSAAEAIHANLSANIQCALTMGRGVWRPVFQCILSCKCSPLLAMPSAGCLPAGFGALGACLQGVAPWVPACKGLRSGCRPAGVEKHPRPRTSLLVPAGTGAGDANLHGSIHTWCL